MPLPNLRRAMALAAVAFLTSACAGGSAGGAPTAAPAPSSADAAEFEAIYQARQDSARMRYTEADVHFMSHMIHHHGQALEMAALAPGRTQNEQIRTLAARITNAQNDEIAIMRRWLEDRGLPVPAEHDEAHDHGAMAQGEVHHGGDPGPSMQMPGMLTAAEMQSLAATRGAEFDRLFLRSMIRHHRGAVTMVEELFATDGAGQDEAVFKFASDAQVDQATEIARMESMLEAMTSSGNG